MLNGEGGATQLVLLAGCVMRPVAALAMNLQLLEPAIAPHFRAV
jgi:hypothetical protein